MPLNWKKYLFVILGLIIINSALFAINLNDFFVSDDFDWLYLTKNSSQPIYHYFTANYYGERGVGGSYRPLINTAFWINYHLFSLNPVPYHLTNLIFQVGVCFLLYLLVLQLFKEYPEKNKLALLTAIFFSLLPNHSEAVIWIAALGDPMATFFYLLSFYGYLLYREKKSFLWLLISLLGFILALLTKEIAITLPLLILVWELYQAVSNNKFKLKDIFYYHFGYWLLLALYFWIRYLAIGLFFGYYVADKIKIEWLKIYEMFVALMVDSFFYGQLRVFLTDYLVLNKLFFFLLFFLILTLLWLSLNKYQYKLPFLFDAFFVLIVPVLILGFNKLTDEGERYNYLPSIIICIILSLLISQIDRKLIKNILLASLVLYFGVFLLYKNYTWDLAANLTKKIILDDFRQFAEQVPATPNFVFLALPDNLAGAQVLRNGIKQAISLYYPEFQSDLQLVPAYVRLDLKNYQQKILYWGPYVTGGYLAETYDRGPWVTGLATGGNANYVFELWGYNYNNYTSSKLRFYLQGADSNAQKENKLKILIFNQGQLQELSVK